MKKGGLAERYLKYEVERLTKDGERLMSIAIRNKEYKNRTMNLHDSYGSAVYLDGRVIPESIRVLNPQSSEYKRWYGSYITGSDEVLDFLREYHSVSKGLSLLVVAAMPYASILENGEGSLKRKYRVISGARDMMDKLAAKYEGSVDVVTTSRI